MHLLLVGNFPQSEKFIVFSGEQANGGLCILWLMIDWYWQRDKILVCNLNTVVFI